MCGDKIMHLRCTGTTVCMYALHFSTQTKREYHTKFIVCLNTNRHVDTQEQTDRGRQTDTHMDMHTPSDFTLQFFFVLFFFLVSSQRMVQVPEAARYSFIRLVVSVSQTLNHIFPESHISNIVFGWKIAVSFPQTQKANLHSIQRRQYNEFRIQCSANPWWLGTWAAASCMPMKLPPSHILTVEPSWYMFWRQSEGIMCVYGVSESKSWWLEE